MTDSLEPLARELWRQSCNDRRSWDDIAPAIRHRIRCIVALRDPGRFNGRLLADSPREADPGASEPSAHQRPPQPG